MMYISIFTPCNFSFLWMSVLKLIFEEKIYIDDTILVLTITEHIKTNLFIHFEISFVYMWLPGTNTCGVRI